MCLICFDREVTRLVLVEVNGVEIFRATHETEKDRFVTGKSKGKVAV